MKTPWLCWVMGLMLALRLAGTVSGQYLVTEEDVRILPVPRPIPEPPIRRPIAPPRPAPSALRLSSVRIEANVRDQVAVTTHHLEVSNPGSGRQQATLLFPVPKGAQLDKFTL
ncbi:MAG TPA: VIT domain-containing protein, partial [Roseimicrobium sp.]|nr:VIT domain-containing protein [Roseimicrobium sp.]